MSLAKLIDRARQDDMFIDIRVRTDREHRRMEVTVWAGGRVSGARPKLAEVFPADRPVGEAIDAVCESQLSYIAVVDRASGKMRQGRCDG